jgi:hypothetical protein
VNTLPFVGELYFGMTQQNMKGWLVSPPEFWKAWESSGSRLSSQRVGPRFFMIISTDNYQALSEVQREELKILGRTPRNFLVSNYL